MDGALAFSWGDGCNASSDSLSRARLGGLEESLFL